MKKAFYALSIGFSFFIISACSNDKQILRHDETLIQLSQKIQLLEKQMEESKQLLNRRETELESIRFELGLLRKELLFIRSPSASVDQSQSEQLSKLLQELSSPTCDTRKLAFELRKIGQRAVMALLDALKKPDLEYRDRVESTFSCLLITDASPFLIGALKDTALRISAARILGNLKDYTLINDLNNYLISNETDDDFLFFIAEAMVKLKDKRGVPSLIEYLKKSDLTKRAIAYNLLNKITGLTMGYKYYAEPNEVTEGARKWSDWWVKNAPAFVFPDEQIEPSQTK